MDVSDVSGQLGNVVPRCIASRMRRWRFPAPDGGGVVAVSYPFVLSSGGGTGEGTLGNTGMGTGRVGMTGVNRPEVPPGRATVRGSLSREVIQRVIRSHINQVRYCYERQLTRMPGIQGRISARFVISPQGTVQSVDVSNQEGRLGEVPQCVARAIRRWRFPEPAGGGIVVVTYPFVFSPSE